MKLSDAGERKITYEITRKFSIPFDDCAYIERKGYYEVMTTDMVNKKTHFPPSASFYQMGWYAMAVNISDLAAKGVEPEVYLVAMGLPRELDMEDYNEIIHGMEMCIKEYGGKIVGGDTKEAIDLTISITAIGIVKKEEFMPRKGMKVKDGVYITGKLGKGGAALRNGDMNQLLLIKPRLKEGRMLASSGKVNSCMDLSDGLASSLYQLMKINGKGFRIYEEMLPIHDNAKKYDDALELALYYGGDYELLFTMPEEGEKELKEEMEITRIGEVIREEKVFLLTDGKEEEMEERGYEHFK